jgi:RNA polymerase subunit RPABC4/transcription elongation factor Spt4
MGSIIKASCKCGYTKGTSLGGSRIDMGRNTPHYCNSCLEVVTIDINDDVHLCPNCQSTDVVSYAAKSKRAEARHKNLAPEELNTLRLHLSSDEAAEDYSPGKHIVLLKQGNYCPGCQKPSLSFVAQGSFS